MTTRLATVGDVRSLVLLMREFYAEADFELDAAWAAASFRGLLADPGLGAAWLTLSAGEPVGHAVLTVRYTMEHGGLSGYIDDLYVRPACRRHGAGRQLLAALFADCRARGCKAAQVEVGTSNQAALALYSQFGLRVASDGRALMSGPVAGP